jgi:hypothetical protein
MKIKIKIDKGMRIIDNWIMYNNEKEFIMKKVIFLVFTLLLTTGMLFSLTGFGESSVFEITDDTLPVTLSSFMAIPNVNNQSISINWTTQSESNLIGYHIHRAESTDLASALIVTSNIISAHNTTLTSNYSFQDAEVESETTYYYWLQSIEYGANNFYGPVTAKISEDNDVPTLPNNTELISIYPNPFSENISTKSAGLLAVSLQKFVDK